MKGDLADTKAELLKELGKGEAGAANADKAKEYKEKKEKLMEKGVFDLGGELPTNTSGGLMGFGHPVGATGVAQGVEVLRQLRQEADPRRQVELNSKRGGMDSHGGTGTFCALNIFERRD